MVGLAVTAELTRRFGKSLSISLVERNPRFGQETSSRNSEVIHAGIYYPAGSLKSELCTEGNRLLYQFCREWGIPHQRTEKLIIARDESEVEPLSGVLRQGLENGVKDLEWLARDQVSTLEPGVRAIAAVKSPSTGIIDSHRLMAQLERQARAGGAMMAYRHEVIGIEPAADRYRVVFRQPDGRFDSMACRWLINSAGLHADQIASWLGIDVEREGYRIYPCKGIYFAVSNQKSRMVSRHIYPPPLKDLKGLGIHATKTIDGRLRFGPNAFYVDELDYSVDIEHLPEFYEAVRSYLPFLEMEDLQPDQAGIRPKLQGPGEPFRDFIIRHEADKGLPGVISLVGIESPGLTSCLSIARRVGGLLETA